jgi:DNA polymerase-3 subunit alpha
MATKNSIKDVARVEGLPLDISNSLCKAIPDRLPDGMKMNLANAIKCTPALQDAEVSMDSRESNTIKYAKMLEGTIRGTGIHACGFIICRDPISDWVPVSTADDPDFPGMKCNVTQYDGHVIESTGLIKMDFLGLKTLSELKEAVKVIKETTGDEVDLDNIPIDDDLTYKLYQEGRTIGTFQFESAGMQKNLRELKPTVFEDLIAMNALYRPGPMDYIPSFIRRKNGLEPIKYDIPCTEKYLKDTYGITVYQEQVMLLSRQLASFTRGESDALRKAMGKKKKAIVDAMKPKFIKQGTANGYDPNILEKIWSDWEKFASYAFNKSHATCYSWVAYQTAYLKAHYPAEYMAALMTRRFDQKTEISKLMEECKSMGIATLGPDVNESRSSFAVNKKGEIRFGMAAISGMGGAAADAIVEEREKNGPFKDIYDFAQRIDFTRVNRKAFESLAYSGGFDSLGLQREQYFGDNGKGGNFLDTLVHYGQEFQHEKQEQMNSLFGGEDVEIKHPIPPKAEKWPVIEKLNKERNLVGIYLSAHPLDEYRIILENMCNTRCREIGRDSDKEELAKREELTFGGIVTNVTERFSQKTGKPFGFVTIEDFDSSGEIGIFGNDWSRWNGMLKKDYSVFITAKCVPRFRDAKVYNINIQNVEQLYDVKSKRLEKLTISIDTKKFEPTMVNDLEEILSDSPGSTQLYFRLRSDDGDVLLHCAKKSVNVDNKLITYLQSNDAMEYKIN